MKNLHLHLCLFLLAACSPHLPEADEIKQQPQLVPEYNGVTVPCNIAPLNFRLEEPVKAIALLTARDFQIRVNSTKGNFEIPRKKWRKLLSEAAGERIVCTVYSYKNKTWTKYRPFSIYVAKDSIDPYLVYRKIAPGYRLWGEMGIYQRNLETFREDAILSNRLTNNNCMNCHSFCMQNSDKMLFHQRTTHGGTYILSNGNLEKLDTKTDKLLSALVYPSWHPSGRYVAFSVNDTKQDFHSSDPNRIEVFDTASDVVVYDTETREVITTPLLSSRESLETYPTFSPDGKRLFFCSAAAKPMPRSYREITYDLVSIPFDPDKRTFGSQTDTLYCTAKKGRSAKFPRVSPDGRYLLYTLSDYGNFSIWHNDADLQLVDLQTGKVDPLPEVNSEKAESYHSWSSNSRWFVFSSRRDDGLYTRPYLCHIDEQGNTSKPFLLPKQHANYYDTHLFSFNIPELIKGKVTLDTHQLVQTSKYKTPKEINH